MKILAAEYVLPIAAPPIENGALAIDKDKIAAVGDRQSIEKQFPAAPVEYFDESAIIPGLINAHSHLEITAMRGFLDDVEADFYAWLMKLTKTRGEILTEADIETAAMSGAIEGARAGVTCFGDIGRIGRAGLNALKANGLRGIVFQETDFAPDDKTADADFARLEEKFRALRKDETALVKIGLSPHAPYTVSRRLFEKIAEYAIAGGIKISTHAAESAAEAELLKRGAGFTAEIYRKMNLEWRAPNCSSIEYLDKIGVLAAAPLLAHCVTVSDADIDLIAASGTKIAHCPKSNAKFGHGIAPLEKFLDAGIAVGFGSDSVASNNVCDILEEARFAALAARSLSAKKRFLTAAEILAAATLGAARALGLDAEIGSLEAGKQADIAVISLAEAAHQPVSDVSAALLFTANARDVRMTMVAGEEIYRDGENLKVDEMKLRGEMRKIAAKLKSPPEK